VAVKIKHRVFFTRKRNCVWLHNCFVSPGFIIQGVAENYGHEFHIPKLEKMSTATCVRRHLFCYSWFCSVREILSVFCLRSAEHFYVSSVLLQMRHVSIEKASSIFTTNTSGQRRILMA
jgi:hypothetical protein